MSKVRHKLLHLIMRKWLWEIFSKKLWNQLSVWSAYGAVTLLSGEQSAGNITCTSPLYSDTTRFAPNHSLSILQSKHLLESEYIPRDAMWRAVFPFLVALSTLAPRLRSSSTTLMWPSLDAKWRALRPFWKQRTPQ